MGVERQVGCHFILRWTLTMKFSAALHERLKFKKMDRDRPHDRHVKNVLCFIKFHRCPTPPHKSKVRRQVIDQKCRS